MTDLQFNLDLTLVTYCNDVVDENSQGSREVPAGGPVELLHEHVRVIKKTGGCSRTAMCRCHYVQYSSTACVLA